MLVKQRLSAISLSILAASLLVSTSGYAANYKGEGGFKEMAQPQQQTMMASASNGLKDGFYVGAQIGHDNYRAHQTSSEVLADGSTVVGSHTPDASGLAGGLFAGYGKYFDAFYLGGELFVNTTGADQTDSVTITSAGSTVSYSSKATVGTSWGISILPGLKVNDSTLAYVRLGYNQAHLKGQETAVDAAAVSAYSSKNDWQGGFNYGLGIETAICNNLSVRGDYSHTSYNSFSNSTTGTKFSFADNQFMLGLSYHFA